MIETTTPIMVTREEREAIYLQFNVRKDRPTQTSFQTILDFEKTKIKIQENIDGKNNIQVPD